jgi:hypothetical protein
MKTTLKKAVIAAAKAQEEYELAIKRAKKNSKGVESLMDELRKIDGIVPQRGQGA